MKNKDLAWIFILSILGLVFVATKTVTKVLFEWYILYVALAAVAGLYIAKLILALM